MPVIILMMALGLAAGFLLRHRRITWVAKVVTALVWLLLLLLGVEVGGNDMIIGNLHRLGLNALIIAALATAGSVAASLLLWCNIKSGTGDGESVTGGDDKSTKKPGNDAMTHINCILRHKPEETER